MGTSMIEFKSLNTEDMLELESISKKMKNAKLTETFAYELDGSSFLSSLFDLHDVINQIGGYLAMGVVLFIVYLAVKHRCSRAAPAVVTTIILFLPLVLSSTLYPRLKISMTANEATQEIEQAQFRMNKFKCNAWSLSEDIDPWNNKVGFYPVSLACALARMKIKCPCDSSLEYVPVVTHDQTRKIKNYTTHECQHQNNVTNYDNDLELFETAVEYLCFNARDEPWSRQHYGQLIATACTVSKMAYNYHCHGRRPHKNIYNDLLSIGVTHYKSDELYDVCEQTKHELELNKSALQTRLFDI